MPLYVDKTTQGNTGVQSVPLRTDGRVHRTRGTTAATGGDAREGGGNVAVVVTDDDGISAGVVDDGDKAADTYPDDKAYTADPAAIAATAGSNITDKDGAIVSTEESRGGSDGGRATFKATAAIATAAPGNDGEGGGGGKGR